MSFEKHLNLVEIPPPEPSTGIAIISFEGEVLNIKGQWKATEEENKSFNLLLSDTPKAFSEGVHYMSMKFIVTQADNDVIFAQKGKKAIIIQKTKKVIVVGFTNGTQIHPSDFSFKVSKIANSINHEE